MRPNVSDRDFARLEERAAQRRREAASLHLQADAQVWRERGFADERDDDTGDRLTHAIMSEGNARGYTRNLSRDEQDALDTPTWGWHSSEGWMRDTDDFDVFTWGWHSSEGRRRDTNRSGPDEGVRCRSPPGLPRNRDIVRPGSVTPRPPAPAARAEACTASVGPDGNLTMQDLEFKKEGGPLPPIYTSPAATGRPKEARNDSVAHGTAETRSQGGTSRTLPLRSGRRPRVRRTLDGESWGPAAARARFACSVRQCRSTTPPRVGRFRTPSNSPHELRHRRS